MVYVKFHFLRSFLLLEHKRIIKVIILWDVPFKMLKSDTFTMLANKNRQTVNFYVFIKDVYLNLLPAITIIYVASAGVISKPIVVGRLFI